MEKILTKVRYFLFSSYRRKALDRLSEKYRSEYKGVVLDIGGRDRGSFKKPKDMVEKWIFADIEAKHKPDLVLDVANMKGTSSESIDTIGALELFEHVEQIKEGLDECQRVLKKGGKMILSVPFLYPIHGDPFDFQRWTLAKWEKEFKSRGFVIEKREIMGRFFLVFAEMIRSLLFSLPRPLRILGYFCLLILEGLILLDRTDFAKNNRKLAGYQGGYFLILRKKDDR